MTPDRLEQLYKNCNGVKNFWVYGEPTWGVLIGVVNVYGDKFLEICRNGGVKGDDWEKMVESDEAKAVF